jgi:hypothetical protein
MVALHYANNRFTDSALKSTTTNFISGSNIKKALDYIIEAVMRGVSGNMIVQQGV